MPNTVGSPAYVAEAPEYLRIRGLEAARDRSMDELSREFAARIAATDRAFGGPGGDFEERLAEAITAGRIVPGTPLWRRILTGQVEAGSVGGACTVISYSKSGSRERVLEALANGAGIGVDLSNEQDPVEALQALNEDILQLDHRLRADNRRPVACMATLSSRHPRVLEFMSMKRNADFMNWRFNISVRVADYGAERDNLVKDFAENAHYCGEPGVLFWDRVDLMAATPTLRPESTAPCAEVALAEGEQCMFGYLNLVAYIREGQCDYKLLERDASLAARMLDNATQICLDAVDDRPSWWQTRRTGVGAMGYADACIATGVRYGSADAVAFARQAAARLFIGASRESVQMARERGAFPLFKDSKFGDDTWVRRTYGRCLTEAASANPAALEELAEGIRRHGIRNSSCVAFPPTGNASELTGVSKSLEPRRTADDLRSGLGALHRYGALDGDPAVTVLVTEDEVSPMQHVEVQAAFQAASIDAVSKTVNLPNHATIDDVQTIFDYAYRTGCKGITVFRDGCLSERS